MTTPAARISVSPPPLRSSYLDRSGPTSAETCVSGSMNLGEMKVVNSVRCCKTNLCNNETLPAPLKQPPNGKLCHTCDDEDCSGTVSCVGSEDRCISASVEEGSKIMPVKGCASKSFCSSGSPRAPGVGIKKVECCEGNLCNGAESFTRSFFIMVVPLLSSSSSLLFL